MERKDAIYELLWRRDSVQSDTIRSAVGQIGRVVNCSTPQARRLLEELAAEGRVTLEYKDPERKHIIKAEIAQPTEYLVHQLSWMRLSEGRQLADLNALYALLSPGEDRVTRADIERAYQHGTLLITAETRDGSIVGMAALAATALPRGNALSVEDLTVHPAHRGNGLGMKLVLAAVMLAKNAGHGSLHLVVRDQMAQQFYTAIGFRTVAQHMQINPQDFDAGTIDAAGVLV